MGAKPRIVVVFNQKGGIGKTTTSVNLAVCLAELGRKVVLVDLDAQSNASTSVGLTSPAATGAYQLLRGEVDVSHASRATPYPNLRLVAGSDDLSWADVEIAVKLDPQYVLERALETTPADVDVVVVDCPPAFGILSVNAAVAADVVILPVVPAPLALDGLHKAWWNIQRVRTHFNRDLESMGILFTMTEDSDVMHRISDSVVASFGGRVLPVRVPRDLKVVEAAARDLPLVILDPESPAAKAYGLLADFVDAHMLEPRAVAPGIAPGPVVEEEEELPPLRQSPPMEPGPAPGANWDEQLAETVDMVPEVSDLRWKIGVAIMLILLGGCVGYAFGRWMYMPL
ncbi:ParA family protein [Paramagnetospirillum magneticum]|uniref:Chromosome partitioning protein ParA n=1 Tax=Paramagnetospirillum magneticum (strain ATCC 700264 / AMB-1) TaxID=342108 RepID=Q2W2S1_PARM1|nr:AAA family ATPase [Paramagnetospirillum magneticum]BAE51854.1 ATPase involved in chromosome partitioning [Paramagnetospirillum magneticum AMB-1]